jgi:membrane protease YdiL (CAAX protease family)
MTAEDPPRWLPPTWAEESQTPPPEPPEPRQVPVWVPFVALLAALLIISLFAALLGGIVAAVDPDVDLKDDTPLGVLFGVMAVQYIVFAATALVALKLALGRIRREDLGLLRVRSVRAAIGWAVLVFLAFLVITAVVSALQDVDEQGLVKDVKAEDAIGILAIYCVLICILAPFFEELFFRGFMYTILWRRLGPIWAALIVGALFGLGHAGDAPWLSVAALGAFGVGLCLLYWRTQSIVPGMALHALNNSITFGAVKELDPALFVGVVFLSVGVVTAAASALSSRQTVTA